MLARLLTRPDMESIHLIDFIQWSSNVLRESRSKEEDLHDR